jgi:hypothetical protein
MDFLLYEVSVRRGVLNLLQVAPDLRIEGVELLQTAQRP